MDQSFSVYSVEHHHKFAEFEVIVCYLEVLLP